MTKIIVTKEEIHEEEEDGKVYHEGICTRSPNGTLWRVNVDDEGNISTEEVVE